MDKATAFAPLDNHERKATAKRDKQAWKAITPVPDDAPEPKKRHSTFGTPSKVWEYRDVAGELLTLVYRFDLEGGKKETRPLSYCHHDKSGVSEWRWQALPAPRPLYGLDKLAAKPEAPAIVCEGEKASDAAALLFPEHIATTPPNGAQSPRLADWQPLAGRVVWIWPDNDEAGQGFAAAVVSHCQQAGAAEVRIIEPACFRPDGDELPAKWDAADAIAERLTPEQAAALVRVVEPPQPEADSGGGLPYGFSMKPEGVYFTPPDDDAQAIWVCSPLEVTATTRNGQAEGHGRLTEFIDVHGVRHQWAMPMEMLAGDGVAMRSRLLDMGLLIASGRNTREYLTRYIQSIRMNSKTCRDRCC